MREKESEIREGVPEEDEPYINTWDLFTGDEAVAVVN